MESKLSLKITVGEDIRRFSITEITWDKIAKTIEKLFPHVDWKNNQITYQDDEGDWVVINSQEELLEAISQLDEKNTILRLSLKQKKPCANETKHGRCGGWERRNFFQQRQSNDKPCGDGNPHGRCGWWGRRNHFHHSKLVQDSLRLMESGNKDDLQAAKLLLNELLQIKPNHPIHTYNLACTEAMLGNIDSAIQHLEKSVAFGFRDFNHIENDKDLVSLRQDERYQKIVNNLKEEKSLGEQCIQSLLSGFTKTMLHHKIMELFGVGTKEALESAKQLLLEQASLDENDSIPPYNLACVEALLGDTKAALEYLERAISLGYNNLNHILQDNDLVSIHQLPEFQKIISVLQPKVQENKQIPVEKCQPKAQENKQIPVTGFQAHAENLQVLKEMGFLFREDNLRALIKVNGNLEAAISYLLN